MDAILIEPTYSAKQRWLPVVGDVMALSRALVASPRATGRVALRAGEEVVRIAAGRSSTHPRKADVRFSDRAWSDNLAYAQLGRVYLALCRLIDELIDAGELDSRSERGARLAAQTLLDSIAPTNFLLSNPAAIKAAFDTGGMSLVGGARQFLRDMARPPRIPSSVDQSAFVVGENIATTPGAVILRTEMFELIQYRSASAKVREVPLIIPAPMINKYYIVDLSPGRSLVEYLLAAGYQVFTISWRNPGKRDAGWDLATYTTALLDVIDVVREVTSASRVHLLGLCAAGLLSCAAASVLVHRREQDRLASLSLLNTPVDSGHSGAVGALRSPELADLAIADVARRGYLTAQALAGTFAWLKPNEGFWRFWVNNYLMGQRPPAHDVLYWNWDNLNLSAGLQRDLLQTSLQNSFARPGTFQVLGAPIDLQAIEVDNYVLGAQGDHITPWKGCFTATRVLQGGSRFVLATRGHVGAIITPPGGRGAKYWVAPAGDVDPDRWLERITPIQDSWWLDWTAWLDERSGDLRAAPDALGSEANPAIGPAPGDYARRHST